MGMTMIGSKTKEADNKNKQKKEMSPIDDAKSVKSYKSSIELLSHLLQTA